MMTTNQEVNDFLEHFGVKGMRWGQRKANVSSGGSSSGGMSAKNKKRLKVAGGVAAAVAIAAGGVAVNRMMKKHGANKLADLNMRKAVDFNFDTHGINMQRAVDSAFRMAGR